MPRLKRPGVWNWFRIATLPVPSFSEVATGARSMLLPACLPVVHAEATVSCQPKLVFRYAKHFLPCVPYSMIVVTDMVNVPSSSPLNKSWEGFSSCKFLGRVEQHVLILQNSLCSFCPQILVQLPWNSQVLLPPMGNKRRWLSTNFVLC
jgi:hypothetical protein